MKIHYTDNLDLINSILSQGGYFDTELSPNFDDVCLHEKDGTLIFYVSHLTHTKLLNKNEIDRLKKNGVF